VERGVSTIQRLAEQVDPSEIDFQGPSSPEGAVTLLFTDIEGSTEMVERLGDERWLEVLRPHNALVRETVDRYGGIEVKSQGDGFMLAFMSSRMGLRCAIDIQRELDAYARDHSGDAPRVRVGMHAGFAIQEDSDYFGRNVILAARIADRARGGEILASQELRDFVAGDPQMHFLEGHSVTLKGLSGRHTVYPVDWRRPVEGRPGGHAPIASPGRRG
jgi:eukaryotic-like serine/threonine-protein kinase